MWKRKYVIAFVLVLAILSNGCISYSDSKYFGDKEPYYEIWWEGNIGFITGEDNQGEYFSAPVDCYREMKPYLYIYGDDGYIIVNYDTREIIQTQKLIHLTKEQRKIFSEESAFQWITDYESVKAIRDSKRIIDNQVQGEFKSAEEVREHYYIPEKTGNFYFDFITESEKELYDIEMYDSNNNHLLATSSGKKGIEIKLRKDEVYHLFLTQKKGMAKYTVKIKETSDREAATVGLGSIRYSITENKIRKENGLCLRSIY